MKKNNYIAPAVELINCEEVPIMLTTSSNGNCGTPEPDHGDCHGGWHGWHPWYHKPGSHSCESSDLSYNVWEDEI